MVLGGVREKPGIIPPSEVPLEATQVYIPNGILIGSAILQGSWALQTD